MAKIYKFDSDEAWAQARLGKVTGTKALDVMPKARGEGLRSGFYDLIAERVALPPDGENRMDRGHRLEREAVERFAKETGKKVTYEKVLCVREDNEDIAYSPDALIGKTEDVEIKCLASGRHIEAWITKKVPKEYESQVIQGFCVNDKLQTRFICFYDPRMPKDFFYLTVKREDVQPKVTEYLALEREALAQIKIYEDQLTF